MNRRQLLKAALVALLAACPLLSIFKKKPVDYSTITWDASSGPIEIEGLVLYRPSDDKIIDSWYKDDKGRYRRYGDYGEYVEGMDVDDLFVRLI